ncbi:MAG: hypothetical protein CMB12_00545 [Euryarchaeota archaeon]|nr:hypothetical protein [Euryarchaeota archaeon]OUX24576.1 MAG: hypothetical protein CBE15_03530 [Euryarchaeota archaeon TMED255]RAH10237.1 MAG: hypothetical protein CMA23_004785 [Euryarchaeota archaeon]
MSDDLVQFLTAGDRTLNILFGSQSGNSEDLASKIGKQASSYGLESTVHDMGEVDLASLSGMKRVLIVCSTWGEGEQPDNAEDLWNNANGDSAPSLNSTNFSVCALGDTSYELFCESGKEWDRRFEELGGKRLLDRVDCDVDYDKPAASWAEMVLPRMAAVDGDGLFQEDKVASISDFVSSGGSLQASDTPTLTSDDVSSKAAIQGGSDTQVFMHEGDRSLHILFGSQSGNSEGLAAKIGKRASAYGLDATVHDMDGFDVSSLSGMSRVLIVCSTWGEGEQPDNAEALWIAANADGAPSLGQTHFSVCALGDTSYELFCESGKEWDKRLEDLGGTRLVDRLDCDVDYDTPSAIWTESVLAHMSAVDGNGTFQAEMVELIIMEIQGDEDVSVDGDDGFVIPNLKSEELQVNVQVFRYDCAVGERGTDEWACILPGNMSVLEVLRTVKETEDGSLTFRDGPANDPCTVISVNGRNVLPGLTKISDIASLVNGSWKIVIEPLTGGEVIRDLVVDLSIHDIRRSSLKPWFHGATRDGIDFSQGVIGSLASSEATEIHSIRDFTSSVLVDSFSDAMSFNESYIGPSNVVSLWSRITDPRTSEKNKADHMSSLASMGGIKAETDLSSISRNGELGMRISSHMLDAKTSVLRDGAFSDSRHGKHVWWYCWSVKMSGKVNDAVIYRQVLGPIGLIGNLFSGVSARMILGFTRTGGRVFNGLLGMVAPPAGVGKMPKQFNTPVKNHHQVVAIYNEIGGGF